MADEQESAGRQIADHPFEQAPLRFAIEINDHVAAEDGIEAGLDRPPFGDQVYLAKGHESANVRLDLSPTLTLSTPAQKVPAFGAVVQFAEGIDGVNGLLRLGQDIRIEVGCQ